MLQADTSPDEPAGGHKDRSSQGHSTGAYLAATLKPTFLLHPLQQAPLPVVLPQAQNAHSLRFPTLQLTLGCFVVVVFPQSTKVAPGFQSLQYSEVHNAMIPGSTHLGFKGPHT
jgi:hypothetical protein